MSHDMTPKQALLLWGLVGASGQAEGKKALPAADRDALLAAGFLRTGWKPGVKAAWVEVTDTGWAWAADHLGDALAPDGKVGAKVLEAWLGVLKRHLDATGTPLAELFMPAPGPLAPEPVKAPPKPRKPAAAKAPKPPTAPKPPKAEKPLTDAQVRTRVTKAYGELTGGRKAVRVLLPELRAKLPAIDRATLDGALTRLHEAGGRIALMRLDDPREITPAVRDAQIMFKGEPLHLIWIDR